jgi:hypothetical protein
MVKCGFCGVQFNALERLRDKPIARTESSRTGNGISEPLPEPVFVIPGEAEPAARQQPLHKSVEAPVKSDRHSHPEAAHQHSPGIPIDENGRILFPESGSAGTVRVESGARQRPTHVHISPDEHGLERDKSFDFSAALTEQPAAKALRPVRWYWLAGVIFMILLAASQLIFFNRDAILQRYAFTIPWYSRLCETFACELIRWRDLSAIKLLNRDVREHPRYQNALLVNATMSNQSQTIQAYPIVQLNLYDTNGNMVAFRQFHPEEYLDAGLDITGGMAPNVPVHFVLEVMEPMAGAVSFEFEFH